MDFFTTEVWTPRGLVTDYVLFVMDSKSRRVHLAGATRHPYAAFMVGVAKALTDAGSGFLRAHRLLICDRADQRQARVKRRDTCTGLPATRECCSNGIRDRRLGSHEGRWTPTGFLMFRARDAQAQSTFEGEAGGHRWLREPAADHAPRGKKRATGQWRRFAM